MNALTPPTSGHDWVALSADPLDASAAIAFASDARAGGIAIFLGTTRSERNDTNCALVALDYEAYEAMAASQLVELTQAARNRGDVIRIVLLHRTGRVGLGEPSVVVAVSTPHRAEAFEICRWLIDSLKAQTTIWKKEIWEDGPGEWVHPGN